MAVVRCAWAQSSQAEQVYHDTEWGVPLYDDQKLFELLCLEGAQAGLSWSTILAKRAGYQQVFHQFAIVRVAAMTDAELEALTQDTRIVRNRRKIYAVRTNAQAALQAIRRHGSLHEYLWGLAGGAPVQNRWHSVQDVPADTATSRSMSAQLKRDGFSFVGPKTCYAFMQAAGMVNDHEVACFRHGECAALGGGEEGSPTHG
ncbi:DNA-3-methyladenine glycosylase I [Candidatus Saccharibacteria bacterium]|nr:DNA-3-methyladenine glycosylase I [Candidatus Saccharibacteria bacterium]